MSDGTRLTLAAVAALAVAGGLRRRGSRSNGPSLEPAEKAAIVRLVRAGHIDQARALSEAAVEMFDLQGANLYGADLQDANLRGADLRGANLRDADLEEANLEGADLQEANLQGADLQGADLKGANLFYANLQVAGLEGANLYGANLYGANLQGAYLRSANLRGADLRGAKLQRAKLQGADLQEANLQGANLYGANLYGTTLTKTIYDDVTVWPQDFLPYQRHGMVNKSSGSRSVVTRQGYHRTALSRHRPSRPVSHFRSQGLVRGEVLDFGSGRGADCAPSTVRCYDPNHPLPTVRGMPSGRFDTVLLVYVLNVLELPNRREALRVAARKVKRGGRLLIAARGEGDGGYAVARQRWNREGDGFTQRDASGELQRFQRFYADDRALQLEVEEELGSGWAPIDVPSLGADTALAAYQRRR